MMDPSLKSATSKPARSLSPSAATEGESGVAYRETDAKSITRLSAYTDSWFLGRYGMNLYRGCEHGCVYCDGRAERYYVEGDFARDISVKRNAIAVLDRELRRIREPGFVLLGGGVCDAYQPAEARFCLARGVLELAAKYRLPVHVLTKSALIERDFDLLEQINAQSRALLSFSIQTLDEDVRKRFEPLAAPTNERFRLLSAAKELGLSTGVMAMPVLPGISDQPHAIDALVARVADLDLDFVCFGGLTLRPGRQKDGFLSAIRQYDPEHMDGYQRIYRQNRSSGAADGRYYERIDRRFRDAIERHGVAGRIPRRLFTGLIPCYTETAVLLEHEQFRRTPSPNPQGELSRAGFAIQKWARSRFTANRSRRYTWQHVEGEFRAMLADRSILSLPEMTEPAYSSIQEMMASLGG